MDNLKTKELIEEENENKRLRSVMNVDRLRFDEKLARQVQKGSELQKGIAELRGRVDLLNVEIADVEHKWQIQISRIPDFPQLYAALERERAAGQRQKAFLRKRQDVFDDFHQKVRRIQEHNEEETRQRMANLSEIMPTLKEERSRQEAKFFSELEKLMAQRNVAYNELLAGFNVRMGV
jgi:hypothetical protein